MHYHEYVRFTEIGALFSFIAFLYMPILSPYLKSLGLNDFQLGLVFSFYSFAVIISSPVMGKLADDIGRRRIIFIGLVCQTVSMVLYILDGSFLVIAVARIINAIGYMTVLTIIAVKIEDCLDSKSRGKYTGWSFSLEFLAKTVSPMIGGILADLLFVTFPFHVAIVFFFVMALYFAKSPVKKHKPKRARDFNPLKEIRKYLGNKTLAGMAILGITVHATIPAFTVFLPLLVIENFGLSFSYVGIALFAFSFCKVFQFYFGSLADRIGTKPMVFLGAFLMSISFFFIWASPTYEILILSLLFAGLGGSVWNVSTWSFMSDIGEKIKKEGMVMMSYTSLANIGTFASYILSGWLALEFGLVFIYFFSGIVMFIGIVLSFAVISTVKSKHRKPEKLNNNGLRLF